MNVEGKEKIRRQERLKIIVPRMVILLFSIIFTFIGLLLEGWLLKTMLFLSSVIALVFLWKSFKEILPILVNGRKWKLEIDEDIMRFFREKSDFYRCDFLLKDEVKEVKISRIHGIFLDEKNMKISFYGNPEKERSIHPLRVFCGDLPYKDIINEIRVRNDWEIVMRHELNDDFFRSEREIMHRFSWDHDELMLPVKREFYEGKKDGVKSLFELLKEYKDHFSWSGGGVEEYEKHIDKELRNAFCEWNPFSLERIFKEVVDKVSETTDNAKKYLDDPLGFERDFYREKIEKLIAVNDEYLNEVSSKYNGENQDEYLSGLEKLKLKFKEEVKGAFDDSDFERASEISKNLRKSVGDLVSNLGRKNEITIIEKANNGVIEMLRKAKEIIFRSENKELVEEIKKVEKTFLSRSKLLLEEFNVEKSFAVAQQTNKKIGEILDRLDSSKNDVQKSSIILPGDPNFKIPEE